MKLRVMLMCAMLALSGVAYATPSGDHNSDGHSDCGKKGCLPGGGGDGGDGGNGGGPKDGGGNGGVGHGGDATAVAGAIGVGVGIGVAESTSASSASASNTNTVSNTNTNTAEGGAGGQAVSAAVVEAGAATAVVESGAVQYTYKEVQQAPAIGQGSFAISGCGVAGNAGGSGPGWAGFLGFGFTPPQCYDFMLAQAYQSIGEKKAVCDILRNSKAGKRQEKRGVVLPECKPEVVQTTVVPVPVPVDLSPYATKEELNRAFKASQSK